MKNKGAKTKMTKLMMKKNKGAKTKMTKLVLKKKKKK